MKKILLVVIMGLVLAGNVQAADQWTKTAPAGTESPSDIDALVIVNNAALDRLLYGYVKGADLAYASATTVTVSAGEVACSNSAGSVVRWRRNTTSTNVTFSDLDTGAEAAGTYYVYAVADTDATTFTFTVSASATAPTGKTYYKRLGYFTNSAALDITSTSVVDDDGLLLSDGAVTTAKLADLAVTNAKIAATTIDLTTKVTGELPLANLTSVTLAKGGTGATTAAGAYTNIVVPKTYDSGWFAVSTGNEYTKTHSLGTTKVIFALYFSPDSGGSPTYLVPSGYDNGYNFDSGGTLGAITTTAATLRAGVGGRNIMTVHTSAGATTSYTSGYFRITGLALE